MKKQTPIFTTVLAKNKPFAVCFSYGTVRNESIPGTVKEWFILIHEADKLHAYKNKGHKSTLKNAFEIVMEQADIAEFKAKQGMFTEVLRNKAGVVFELKKQPFKAYFNMLNNIQKHVV